MLAQMSRGPADFKALWLSQNIDASCPDALTAFYRDQFVEAYELAHWHAGLLSGQPPLHYPWASAVARHLRMVRALDFGSGIGSGSLCLASVGCEVHSADIAVQLLSLVDFRMTKHGYGALTVDLARGSRPHRNHYDLITCFDVLEHVPDQLEKIRELTGYLRPGGLLFVNFMNDSFHPDRPMHISSAGDWLHLARRTALVPEWSLFRKDCQVLRRAPWGRAINAVGFVVDTLQGWGHRTPAKT